MLSKLIGALIAVVLVAGGWAIRPRSMELADDRTGDPALQSFIEANYDKPGHRLAVAVVDGGSVKFAGRGADEHSAFEIGSISKGLTGMLLADAVSRGEVKLDQQVGSLLPLAGAPVASVTLEELATHHSGLPRVSMRPLVAVRSLFASLQANNPYPYDVDELLAQARAAKTGGRGEPEYSNLGAAVLGQALARKAGKSYPDLLDERLLRPLGMQESRTPTGKAGAAPEGYGTGGRKQEQWIQDGYAPAGGVVSTSGDLALLAQSLLSGEHVAALAPRRDFEDEDERIGMFWITSPLTGSDRSMVWHNGGTGGYSSFIGLDLENERAVVVLSDVAAPIDPFATKLLAEES